ncbi:hypothetical protein DSCA_31570 [Desulfosarcina alkanivorans]|uniref:Uncharacterized protein n=1 Tax=Desulfosarcina alkanivorans TaxID=571177 RepID=A0A5K7YX12_9BACT|nr:hypothetical protein DSCA_31570 [Desulfosarcina alkanivorans]
MAFNRDDVWMFKTIRSPTRASAVLMASTFISISLPPPSPWQVSLEEQDAQALERVVFTHAVPDPSVPILKTTPSSVAINVSLYLVESTGMTMITR